MVLKLLLAEEQRLGDYSTEHLAIPDQHIAKNDEFIAKQRTIIVQLNGNGHARTARSAELLLNTLIETQDLYHQHRERIRNSPLK
jgi:hypothetical protein